MLDFNVRKWETSKLDGAYISVFNDDFVISGAITPAIATDNYNNFYLMTVDVFHKAKRIGEWEHQYENIDSALTDFKEFSIDYFKVMGEDGANQLI